MSQKGIEELLIFARDSLIASGGSRKGAHALMVQTLNYNPILWEQLGKAVSTLGLWLATGLAAGHGEGDEEDTTWNVAAEVAKIKEQIQKKEKKHV